MTQFWMIDVLKDVRGFAEKNAMLGLAEHLEDAILIATAELRETAEEERILERDECDTFRDHHRKARDS